MSSIIDERSAYLRNPFFDKHLYGNYTPFYITIAVCTLLGFFLFALNIALGCCSKHRQYWQDRHSGNRWLVSIWSATPHKQPPLDLTELQDVTTFVPAPANTEYDPREYEAVAYKQKQAQPYQGGYEGRGFGPGHHHNPEEYVELQQKRIESDIQVKEEKKQSITMVFTVLYPAVAAVAMFVILIIMIMLKHGPRLCGLRHDISNRREGYMGGGDEAAYDHRISVAA